MKNKEMKNIDIKKMPENDRRLLAYLKRTNYDKYIEFLSKYVFPNTPSTDQKKI
ncbi:unnamed protein product [marine sediment metagenome]|uniref:Uncharacterized protein n=1 Tax=marine sediment metagenome TaxID=412755 RepID=X1I216_9ZZZZ